RRPDRVSRLVLVSAPSPRWPLDPRTLKYVDRPLRSLPHFLVRSMGRLTPDIVSAHRSWQQRVGFLARHLSRVLRFPSSPTRMAGWARDWQAEDIAADCARITAPTLL